MSSLPGIPGMGMGGSGLGSFMSLAQGLMGGGSPTAGSSSSPLQSLFGGGLGGGQMSPFASASDSGGSGGRQVSPFGDMSDAGGVLSGIVAPFLSLLGGGSGGGGGGGTGSANTSSPSNQAQDPSGGGTGKSPTLQELSSAANSTYGIPGSSDLKPLEQNGKAVTETDQSGMVGQAYVTPQNKVIVAFGGTGSGGGSVLPGQIGADVTGGAGGVSQAQQDAAKFAQKVQGIAAQQGIGSQDVFTAGHSLGGMEAQYASAQTGLPGISFEGPGSTAGPNPKGSGSNFVDVQDKGDLIANIGHHYGKTLSVDSGLGILGHVPGAQNSRLPMNESLNDVAAGLNS